MYINLGVIIPANLYGKKERDVTQIKRLDEMELPVSSKPIRDIRQSRKSQDLPFAELLKCQLNY